MRHAISAAAAASGTVLMALALFGEPAAYMRDVGTGWRSLTGADAQTVDSDGAATSATDTASQVAALKLEMSQLREALAERGQGGTGKMPGGSAPADAKGAGGATSPDAADSGGIAPADRLDVLATPEPPAAVVAPPAPAVAATRPGTDSILDDPARRAVARADLPPPVAALDDAARHVAPQADRASPAVIASRATIPVPQVAVPAPQAAIPTPPSVPTQPAAMPTPPAAVVAPPVAAAAPPANYPASLAPPLAAPLAASGASQAGGPSPRVAIPFPWIAAPAPQAANPVPPVAIPTPQGPVRSDASASSPPPGARTAARAVARGGSKADPAILPAPPAPPMAEPAAPPAEIAPKFAARRLPPAQDTAPDRTESRPSSREIVAEKPGFPPIQAGSPPRDAASGTQTAYGQDETDAVLTRLRQNMSAQPVIPPATVLPRSAEVPQSARPSDLAEPIGRLRSARTDLVAGRVDAARRQLQQAQLSLVFRPIDDAAAAASNGAAAVGQALGALGRNDVRGSLNFVEHAVADLSHPSAAAPPAASEVAGGLCASLSAALTNSFR